MNTHPAQNAAKTLVYVAIIGGIIVLGFLLVAIVSDLGKSLLETAFQDPGFP